MAFLDDLAHGTYDVACLDAGERRLAAEVARGYRDLELGLADITLIVLAARLETVRLLTLNQRDFRAAAPLTGGAFVLLPADA